MDVTPDKQKVADLIDSAYTGKLCLPRFQRDFVWTRAAVADLVRSILRQYFIGSLLFLRCDPDNPPFAPVLLRGAKSPYRDPRPDRLVLDGQQRLTALLYALTAPNLNLKDSSHRRWFFVDLNMLLEDPENDAVVFDLSERELDGLDRPEVQYARRILPCTRLRGLEEFYEWRDGFEDWMAKQEPHNVQVYRNQWRGPWTRAVTDFQSFLVPLVELPEAKEDDPEAIARVCAIFEKLNSTGVELSVYDLLTARLYSSRIDLHNLWDEACGKHKRLAEWSEGQAHINRFGVLVLRTLALLRGLEAKPSTLIKLQASDFERDWKRAAAAMERAIELATLVGPDGFGVFDRKWMPGLALLPVLAALRAQVDDRGLPESARVDLRRWYWCNVFLERYSSAVESKSRKDYSEFMGYWKEGKGEPAVFGEARALIGADGYTIRDAASYASNVYNGVFCLLALRGARDWRLGENIQLQDLHDHHIFPRAYLRTAGLEQSNQINSIVNRTLIGDETNGKIKDAAPAQYLANAEIFKQDEAKIRSLLAPHFISASTLEIMRRATPGLSDADAVNVYRQFMKAREAAIINEIRYVCGIA